jgi:hypothetical protein
LVGYWKLLLIRFGKREKSKGIVVLQQIIWIDKKSPAGGGSRLM